jgi:dTDP-4-amino-4,6-dideoxygalactose transaminase
MQKEIGSNFWLSPEESGASHSVPESFSPSIFGYRGSNYVWMSTGRSALTLVIKTIEERNPKVNKIVCLPPFTCHTVFEPFIEAGYKIVTFSIGKDLVTDGVEIVRCALKHNAGIVLFHRYFGFDTVYGLDKTITELRSHGIITIEDTTQSLYSTFAPSPADCYVASIRKWCEVPDGGFAVCREGNFHIRPYEADHKLGSAKIEASLLKYDWIVNGRGEKETFLNKYREAEDILNAQDRFYSINPLSLAIQSRLDINRLKERRRENYKILLNGILGIKGIKPVFENLDNGIVPLYFPIFCESRKFVQSLLVRNNIFAPIVWPKAENCPAIDQNAEFIYDHILCIPIDQRYDSDDIARIINVLKSELFWTGWMTWEQIEPFKEQLIDWELEVMVKYHYPDKIINRDYPASRVENLKSYLESGNTFFWGAVENSKLVGYYWAYISDFLGYKRWNSRSSYTCESARGRGISKMAHKAALEKAMELRCDEAVSSYAHFNSAMAHIYQNLGYETSRIEIVKRLNRTEKLPPLVVMT